MAKPLKNINVSIKINQKELKQILFLAEKLELNNSDILREGLRLLYEMEVKENKWVILRNV